MVILSPPGLNVKSVARNLPETLTFRPGGIVENIFLRLPMLQFFFFCRKFPRNIHIHSAALKKPIEERKMRDEPASLEQAAPTSSFQRE
jgi:hypothetical protein